MYNSKISRKLTGRIDLNSKESEFIYNKLKRACAESLKEQGKQKGDKDMEAYYKSYLTEEEKAEAEARGEARGELSGQIKLLYKKFNFTPEQIADELGIEEIDDIQILEEAKYI